MSLPITAISDIDIDRHAVIEASAGTGKTYTIENLVVRILSEKQVPIEQILIVTYTEKATGELQSRIRANIAKALAADPNEHLRVALDNFDNASIHTIHGFCQRLLRQYAFENSESFEHELVDDHPVHMRMLHEIMRRDWPLLYGEKLCDMLALSQYPRVRMDVSEWEKEVVNLCQRYRPQCGDRLLPEATLDALTDGEACLARHLDKLLPLLGQIDSELIPKSDFYTFYHDLPVNGRSREGLLTKLVGPLLKLALAHQNKNATLYTYAQFMASCRTDNAFKDHGFALLQKRLTKEAQQPEYEKQCQRLAAVVDCLEALRGELDANALQGLLQVLTIHGLIDQVQAYKSQHGYISYNDMLELVRQALDADVNPQAAALTIALRKRYCYALVDEFQDTDPVQWRIFRTIFCGSDDHRLMLIGDPKQAIYGFRGADVDTYLLACEELREQHGAMTYTLPINWRSRAELIDACNTIFASPEWFRTNGLIPFSPVLPSQIPDDKTALDSTGRPALVRIELPPELSGAKARVHCASFIAAEVAALLANPGQIRLWDKQAQAHRDLNADDICLLVRSRTEAIPLEKELTARRVPVSHYKKAGLYQSDECLQLLHLLGAIAQPDDPQAFRKALLTRWFRIAPAELPAYEDVAAGHPIRLMFERWVELAGDRDWPRLFRALQEETRLLCQEIAESDGERRVTNYRHLMQELLLQADACHLDAGGMVVYLRRLRGNTEKAEAEGDLHRLETERPKVKVMTMHACKGLEFPIVFMAGGYTSSSGASFHIFHEDGHLVYDLAKDPATKPQHDWEVEEEQRRLFYVALTRASHRLYVPWQSDENKSPLGGFIRTSLSEPSLPDPVSSVEPLDYLRMAEAREVVLPDPPPLPEPLLPPRAPDLRSRRLRVESFSSLHTHPNDVRGATAATDLARAVDAYQRSYDHPVARSDDETTPADQPMAVMEILPPGTRTGSLLHDVLEAIDYQAVAAAGKPDALIAEGTESRLLIESCLERYQMLAGVTEEGAQERRLEVARLVHLTLRTPLTDGFRLCDLPASNRLHELEFHFPGPLTEAERIPDISLDAAGYIHGYIDLLFRWQGAVYILDWKSNLLTAGYDPANLERTMQEAGYHLQYQLYRIAVDRWLGGGDAYRFGGVYYLFLRGMNGTDAESGVYHVPGMVYA